MSLETLLQAAEFVESSSERSTKENPSTARGNLSSHVFVDRRRVVSESEATERRRRPGGAGTRETHNKLEKNRRAHLKECFDTLKRQVPTLDEKKTSNLNILRSALKYIQTMKKEEEDFVSEVDLLKTNKEKLLEQLGQLKSKSKLKQTTRDTSSTSTENALSQPKNGTSSTESVDSRIPPVSVATQTTPNLDKEGTNASSLTEVEEVPNTCTSTSSTDTGVDDDGSDRKLSICNDDYDDDDDEKTDTDDGCNDDDDQDIEIDVVGQDDNSSSDSLRIAVEVTTAQENRNGEIGAGKTKMPSGTRGGRSSSNFTRKRSKSEMRHEEDSDYDENTKEEPKAKIQACARVSV